MEVHRLVLEMMKAVAVTEANAGVLNLKTTRRGSLSPHSNGSSPSTSGSPITPTSTTSTNGILNGGGTGSPPVEGIAGSPEGHHHPFREYMDNAGGGCDVSVSDGEEIMAYVNMKVSKIINSPS